MQGERKVFSLSGSCSADTYQLDDRGGGEGRGGEERRGKWRRREER